mmetsp:Transcript_6906/g.16004  ORF Transcript_6906/g.16004 Transcript_6906/m.16004 type:complete len:329 (-) Transcript_6906:90-1076(-)
MPENNRECEPIAQLLRQKIQSYRSELHNHHQPTTDSISPARRRAVLETRPMALPKQQQSKNPHFTLAMLISQRKWSLIDALLSTPDAPRLPVDEPGIDNAVTPDIVVHFAARFQAPLRIISLLSGLYPRSLTSPDMAGRYPIHVAAKWGATPDVIRFLVEAGPSVVGVPDSAGKTPMHYVGESYVAHYNSDLYNRSEAMMHVVRMLKTSAPASVNLEDGEGMNAIEYALDSDADIRVIKVMQRACRDDWRERQLVRHAAASAAAGRRRHDDLVEEMHVMADRLQRETTGRGGSSPRAGTKKRAASRRVNLPLHGARAERPASQTARTA